MPNQTAPTNEAAACCKLCPVGICLLVMFITVPLTNYLVPGFLESQDRFADDSQTKFNAAKSKAHDPRSRDG